MVGRDKFIIRGNLIYWSSTKSKRITRSILASEIYSMVAGVDIVYAISSILKLIIM
jgi:predicted phosphohydrolase